MSDNQIIGIKTKQDKANTYGLFYEAIANYDGNLPKLRKRLEKIISGSAANKDTAKKILDKEFWKVERLVGRSYEVPGDAIETDVW